MKIKQLVFEKDSNYVGNEILIAKGVLNDFILTKNLKSENGFFAVWVDNFAVGQFEFEQANQKANEINEEKYNFMNDLLKQWEVK